MFKTLSGTNAMTAAATILAGFVLVLGAAQDREVTDAGGTITAVNASQGWYGIVPDADRGIRYSPDALAEEFRKDGLRVVFSGRVGRVDPNVRTWGIPLVLTKIRVE